MCWSPAEAPVEKKPKKKNFLPAISTQQLFDLVLVKKFSSFLVLSQLIPDFSTMFFTSVQHHTTVSCHQHLKGLQVLTEFCWVSKDYMQSLQKPERSFRMILDAGL